MYRCLVSFDFTAKFTPIIPRLAIAALLRALPVSCVMMEREMECYDGDSIRNSLGHDGDANGVNLFDELRAFAASDALSSCQDTLRVRYHSGRLRPRAKLPRY